jgi:hypothetical protein
MTQDLKAGNRPRYLITLFIFTFALIPFTSCVTAEPMDVANSDLRHVEIELYANAPLVRIRTASDFHQIVSEKQIRTIFVKRQEPTKTDVLPSTEFSINTGDGFLYILRGRGYTTLTEMLNGDLAGFSDGSNFQTAIGLGINSYEIYKAYIENSFHSIEDASKAVEMGIIDIDRNQYPTKLPFEMSDEHVISIIVPMIKARQLENSNNAIPETLLRISETWHLVDKRGWIISTGLSFSRNIYSGLPPTTQRLQNSLTPFDPPSDNRGIYRANAVGQGNASGAAAKRIPEMSVVHFRTLGEEGTRLGLESLGEYAGLPLICEDAPLVRTDENKWLYVRDLPDERVIRELDLTDDEYAEVKEVLPSRDRPSNNRSGIRLFEKNAALYSKIRSMLYVDGKISGNVSEIVSMASPKSSASDWFYLSRLHNVDTITDLKAITVALSRGFVTVTEHENAISKGFTDAAQYRYAIDRGFPDKESYEIAKRNQIETLDDLEKYIEIYSELEAISDSIGYESKADGFFHYFIRELPEGTYWMEKIKAEYDLAIANYFYTRSDNQRDNLLNRIDSSISRLSISRMRELISGGSFAELGEFNDEEGGFLRRNRDSAQKAQ